MSEEEFLAMQQQGMQTESLEQLEVLDVPEQQVEVENEVDILPSITSWKKVTPRHLYHHPKPAALRVGLTSTASTLSSPSSPSTSSPSTSSSSLEALKRTVAEASEWAKASKRRRPSAPSDDATAKLLAAKLQYTVLMTEKISEKREQKVLRAARAEAREVEEGDGGRAPEASGIKNEAGPWPL